MTFLTKDILEFYKFNETNSWYLKKLFSDHDSLGLFDPYYKTPFNTKWDGKNANAGTVDEHNTYNINRLGYRGEVYENFDILASGCSITFGIGVPESERWTEVLSRKTNKEVMNLGSPGASVESICLNLIQHCLNNKMPKEIFCLFPDFFRSMVVVDKEFYKSGFLRVDIGKQDFLQYIYCNPNIKTDGDYIFMQVEDQKNIEDSRSPHQLILNSINAIYTLEAFCLANKIKLKWTTWDVASSMVINELLNLKDFKLKNFTPLFPPGTKAWAVYVDTSCRLYHEPELKNSPWWSIGSDYSIINGKKDTSRSHPGMHLQHHVADFFYKLYKKENNENN